MPRSFSPETTSGLEGPPVEAGQVFLTEMFSGIQGEGPYVGVRQLFVRFGGCDLRCSWCDTPGSLVRRGPGRFETRPGSREFIEVDNPLTLERAVDLVKGLDPAGHHSVTFTGGEPLLQPEAIDRLQDEVRLSGGRTWLETHGGRVRELEAVISGTDYVSMDLKLPSSSGDFVPLAVHRRFLEVASTRETFAKVVVTPNTEVDEVVGAAEMVESVDPRVVLVLQQVTPFGRVKSSPLPRQMLELQDACMLAHPNTRVIPQTHKLTGQL